MKFSGESLQWMLITSDEKNITASKILRYVNAWRSEGRLSQDVALRAWSPNANGRIMVSTGLVDGGVALEANRVDARFTFGACQAMLAALEVREEACITNSDGGVAER